MMKNINYSDNFMIDGRVIATFVANVQMNGMMNFGFNVADREAYQEHQQECDDAMRTFKATVLEDIEKLNM